jgi:Hermes transposase DNA-binding domain
MTSSTNTSLSPIHLCGDSPASNAEASRSDLYVIYTSLSPTRSSKTVDSQSLSSSIEVKRSLQQNKIRYRVEPNQSKRATAACWKTFGFPAMMSSHDESQFEIIPGYASCKSCFETYRYVDSSTANLNSHICPRMSSANQSRIKRTTQSTGSSIDFKLVATKKKEMTSLCARWIADSMRPFSIVNDHGFKLIVDKCIDIGRINYVYHRLAVSFIFQGKAFALLIPMSAPVRSCLATERSETKLIELRK